MTDPDYETRLRDEAALAAFGPVIAAIIRAEIVSPDGKLFEVEALASQQAHAFADAFIAERANRYSQSPVGDTDDSSDSEEFVA
ncbi:MAG: hypothetical protein ACRCVX_12645 [Shewanella sp.]